MGQIHKLRARLDRQFDQMARQIPALAGFMRVVRHDRALIIRFPVAVILILGGIFSFLPILGLWMLPIGLMLLAIDLPFLRGPIGGLMVRGRRKIAMWRRRR